MTTMPMHTLVFQATANEEEAAIMRALNLCQWSRLLGRYKWSRQLCSRCPAEQAAARSLTALTSLSLLHVQDLRTQKSRRHNHAAATQHGA